MTNIDPGEGISCSDEERIFSGVSALLEHMDAAVDLGGSARCRELTDEEKATAVEIFAKYEIEIQPTSLCLWLIEWEGGDESVAVDISDGYITTQYAMYEDGDTLLPCKQVFEDPACDMSIPGKDLDTFLGAQAIFEHAWPEQHARERLEIAEGFAQELQVGMDEISPQEYAALLELVATLRAA